MLKRFLILFSVLLLVAMGFAALLASEWLPPTRPEHQAALDLLRQPQPPATGRSAFAVMWFLGHDIGGRDPDELLRQDLAAFDALAPTYEGFRSVAADFPERRLLSKIICPSFPEPCLPMLRELPDAGAALRETYGGQLRASERLVSADHYTHPFPHEGPLQFPPMPVPIGLRRFAHAQAFVSGDGAGGIAATCADLAAWRRLRPTTDLLIHDMVAIAFAQSQAGLLAEMLAEWPAGRPLPAVCDLALAPVAETGRDQCNVWRGEARFTTASIERSRGEEAPDGEYPLPGWLSEVLVNSRNAIEYQAYEQALGCDAFRGVPRPEPGWMDWVFDWNGTRQREADKPTDLSAYRGRHLEYFDVLQSLRIAAWLRGQPDRKAGWKDLPAGLAPAPSRLSYDDRAEGLVLDLQPGSGQAARRWVIPLPPALPARAPPG
jgi:hypothetical protein